MKKMILAAVVLVMPLANAEELKFGDVNYFLKKSQSNLILDLNQTNIQNKPGVNTLQTKSLLFSATYAYAFSSQLNAFVGLDYAYDNRTEDKSGVGDPPVFDNSFRSDGFSNPAIGLNYRLYNQNSSRYNLDFGAVARINVEEAKSGRLGPGHEDGNFANGRSSLELNSRMGRKWNEANEWQLAVGLNYFKDGESVQRASGSDTDIDLDSSFDLFVRATYQYRPVHEFMMLASLQATQVGEAESDAEGTGGKSKADAYTDVDFTFVAKYLVTESFIAKFNYGLAVYSPDYDVKVDGVTQEVQRRRGSFFGIGLDFLF